MLARPLLAVRPTLYSARVPVGVILPMALVPVSVNQRLPSAPAVIPDGLVPGVRLYSTTSPLGVIWPILLVPASVNQRLPSGPAAMPIGLLPGARLYSVRLPLGVIS